MKKILLTACFSFLVVSVFPQNNCASRHPLFLLNNNSIPQSITVLGKGKEFFPLHMLKTSGIVYQHIIQPQLWKSYPDELKELNILLKTIGFIKGISSPEFTADKITQESIPYDSQGNLGGTRRGKHGKRKIEYYFSKLHIIGGEKGIPAWKITSPTGCYFYILKKCGNAYYNNNNCCHTVDVIVKSLPLTINQNFVIKQIPLVICTYRTVHYYQDVKTVISHSKNGRVSQLKYSHPCKDSTNTIITCKDTIVKIKTNEANSYTVYIDTVSKQIICTDTSIVIKGQLRLTGTGEAIITNRPDTIRIYTSTNELCAGCSKKFELGASGGFSYNTVPGLITNTIHTRAANAHFNGDIYWSYLFSQTFQAGVDIGYFTLAYKDDAPYPRPATAASPYSKVYLGKPVVPVQLFGKLSWRSSGSLSTYLLLSAGYAIVSNDQIRNNNILLTTNPNISNGFVAGLGLGTDYFWNCNWGIGTSVKVTYFSLPGSSQHYNFFAFPVTAGLRYRF